MPKYKPKKATAPAAKGGKTPMPPAAWGCILLLVFLFVLLFLVMYFTVQQA